jgi:hypothetical protein
MKWLGIIAVMAVAAIILSVVTDVGDDQVSKWLRLCDDAFLQARHPGHDYPIRMQVSWRL